MSHFLLGFLPRLLPEDIDFYVADALSVTKPTVSKHWRKLKAMTQTSDPTWSFFTYKTIKGCCLLYASSLMPHTFNIHLLGCQIPIRFPSHLSALHLAPIFSASQPLQFGILSLQFSQCVPALIPSAVTARPTVSSRPSNPLSTFFLRLKVALDDYCACYFFYLPTY